MSRKAMENELLEAAFPLFTSDLRGLISEVYTTHRNDLGREERMLDAVWSRFGRRIRPLMEQSNEGEDQQVASIDPNQLRLARRKWLLNYIEQAEAFAESLLELADGEIAAQYDAKTLASQAVLKANRTKKAEQRDRFAFFNRPNAVADYEKWLKKKVWTSEEATALTLGKEPKVVNVKSLSEYKSIVGSLFRDKFLDRLDEIERAIAAHELFIPLRPDKFVTWADGEFPDLPQVLVAHAKAANKGQSTPAHSNHLHTCYRIILALAISKYSFDATVNENDPQPCDFKTMLADINEAGAELHRKTLKTTLDKAFTWELSKEQSMVTLARRRKVTARHTKPASK
jgi:hypothetical protein